ncbi:hypothetical protein J3R30DRAFT_3873990 [Lentinula aciculospora]|uniref:Nucleolar protein 12 n=1 Tax=Lentinula aciculospora TaxID=153920 RepID=A0A9W9DPZ3_9AGAR|nr:hypothetical protein J3R30DRAFT_3873990 [Lentinula aciculospora]
MALSSFLLASSTKKNVIDAELDALFSQSVGGSSSTPALSSGTLKRKHADVVAVESTTKKRKVKDPKVSPKQRKKAPPADLEKAKTKLNKKKKSTKELKANDDDHATESQSDDDDENDSGPENAYLSRAVKGKGKAVSDLDGEEEKTEIEEGDEDSSSSEDDDEDRPPPQHESLTKKQSSKKPPKSISKYVPPDETLEQRNARTIFVGNLNVEVSQKKSLLKSLQRHILSLIPTSSDSSNAKPKIESTRFRSVPFAIPTSTLEKDEDQPSTKKNNSKSSSTKARQHDLDRAKSWKKSSVDKNEEEDSTKGEKQFLTPAQKKKIAFINQEIHASGSSVNAYIVFAHPIPTSAFDEVPKRKSNLPPLPDVMNPYEAARLAKEACDGSEYMERTLRVDVVAQNVDISAVEAQGRVLRTGSDVDPKRCIFVGNLDFESKEEDVRVYFEGVVSTEKGPRPIKENGNDTESDDDDGNEEKLKAVGRSDGWVTRVRIIRDKDTQLGKGFAYVQFAERDCVDEIIAASLEPGKLKFAKRKLRVERCKTIPGGSFKVKINSVSSSSSRTKNHLSKPNRSTSTSVPIPIPKGDPSLGAKLAHLSKLERKSAKAADADRMARRLAKKKSRMAMAAGGGAGTGGVKIRGKERGRERKPRSRGGALPGKGRGGGSAHKK